MEIYSLSNKNILLSKNIFFYRMKIFLPNANIFLWNENNSYRILLHFGNHSFLRSIINSPAPRRQFTHKQLDKNYTVNLHEWPVDLRMVDQSVNSLTLWKYRKTKISTFSTLSLCLAMASMCKCTLATPVEGYQFDYHYVIRSIKGWSIHR